MTALVREFDDFVFDRRTITRTDPFDLAAVEWGAGDVIADNLMRLGRRISDIARYLFPLYLIG